MFDDLLRKCSKICRGNVSFTDHGLWNSSPPLFAATFTLSDTFSQDWRICSKQNLQKHPVQFSDIYSIRILCAAQKSLDAQMIHGRLASNPNLVKDWVNGPNGQWASPLCDPNILVGGSIECVAQKYQYHPSLPQDRPTTDPDYHLPTRSHIRHHQPIAVIVVAGKEYFGWRTRVTHKESFFVSS